MSARKLIASPTALLRQQRVALCLFPVRPSRYITGLFGHGRLVQSHKKFMLLSCGDSPLSRRVTILSQAYTQLLRCSETGMENRGSFRRGERALWSVFGGSPASVASCEVQRVVLTLANLRTSTIGDMIPLCGCPAQEEAVDRCILIRVPFSNSSRRGSSAAHISTHKPPCLTLLNASHGRDITYHLHFLRLVAGGAEYLTQQPNLRAIGS